MAGCSRESPDLLEEEEEFSNPLNDCEDESTDEEWDTVDDTSFPTDRTRLTLTAGVATVKKKSDAVENSEISVKVDPSPSAPISRIGLNDHKAGMEGLDKAKINQIILEASRGSKYYENELKKEKQVSKRIESMLKELSSVTPAQRAAALKAADKELEALEARRDLGHIVVHIDMDAFYASVEMRDDPRLRDVPMAVGGNAMLSTSNYLARRFGVRAAMPGFIAKKLCPELVIVPLHFDKYKAASELVREILAKYDPHFSPVGLDESYLDLTEFVQLKLRQNATKSPDMAVAGSSGCDSDPEAHAGDLYSEDETWSNAGPLSPLHWKCVEEVVEGMRREIRDRTNLTASAGLAPNMMLAKVASDMNKPDGQYTVTATREGVVEFVQKLPIRKISGIGRVREHMLNALKVTTCGELYQQRGLLHLLFSHTSSTHFLRVSVGLGSTHVHREYDRKSMSTERTFAEISSVADLQLKCRELCDDLAHDMQQHLIKGRNVAVKLKTVHFEVKTRAVTLPRPVSSADKLYSAASGLLATEIKACAPSPLRLRLMGVRISTLQKAEEEDGRGGGKQETLDVFMHSSSASSAVTQTNTSPAKTHADEVGLSGHRVQCPVCGSMLDETDDYRSINTHIDECLNQSAITSITQHTTGSPEKTKTSRETNHLVSPHKAGAMGSEREQRAAHNSQRKTPVVAAGSGSRKRQLVSVSDLKSKLEGADPDPMKRRKTLDYFWK